MAQPTTETINLEVHKHISGGILIRFGRDEIVLSPDDGLGLARAICGALNLEISKLALKNGTKIFSS